MNWLDDERLRNIWPIIFKYKKEFEDLDKQDFKKHQLRFNGSSLEELKKYKIIDEDENSLDSDFYDETFVMAQLLDLTSFIYCKIDTHEGIDFMTYKGGKYKIKRYHEFQNKLWVLEEI